VSWIYNQTTGQLSLNGIFAGIGYSGKGNGKNNPELEATPKVGPIPCGLWAIGSPRTDPEVGEYAMPLSPMPGTETYGRTAFFLHGDNPEHLGESSEGCIVAPPNVRTRIWQSGVRTLSVISGMTPTVERG
jgi:hypothetical protein